MEHDALVERHASHVEPIDERVRVGVSKRDAEQHLGVIATVERLVNLSWSRSPDVALSVRIPDDACLSETAYRFPIFFIDAAAFCPYDSPVEHALNDLLGNQRAACSHLG